MSQTMLVPDRKHSDEEHWEKERLPANSAARIAGVLSCEAAQPSISLIIATYGRTDTLDRLLASIARQQWLNLECILVDQNDDNRLALVFERWQADLSLRVIRLSPHLSRARNAGLDLARGEIIAFPDDDCWYSAGVFAKAAAFFRERPEFDILSVRILDEHSVPSGNRWIQERCELAPINIFRTSVTYGSFFRRRALGPAPGPRVRFDEGIGPNSGTAYGCGEDTDFVLQSMKQGARGFFDAALTVHHPRRDMLSGLISRERAVSYGMGMGHVLAKHRMAALGCSFLAYDAVRIAACLMQLKVEAAKLCLAHACGVWRGYRSTVQRRRTTVRG